MKIKAEPLKTADLEGIGKAILIKEDTKPDAQDDIQTYYGKLGVFTDIGSLQAGICIAKNRPMVVDEFEQHHMTEETLAALKGDFIVAAAPVDGETGKPVLEKARAFRVEQGEGIFFYKNVWHWTPFPAGAEASVLVLFKEDTPRDDFTPIKLDEKIEIE